MRLKAFVLAGWLLAFGWLPSARSAEAVLRVVTVEGATNRVRNGDFESRSGDQLAGWSPAPQGYRVAAGEGRGGSTALAVEAPNTSGWRGAQQTLVLNRTNVAPLTIRGWSRAAEVSGSADHDYSLYVDLIYQDGTPLWGRTANFSAGTHDWQVREIVVVPEKPVKSLTLYCLFRNHSGRAWFDDVAVLETTASGDAFVFQGTPMESVSPRTPPLAAEVSRATDDGLRLGLHGTRVVSLSLDGRELASTNYGGFLARDVAAGSDAFGFEQGSCPELGLGLETRIEARPDHLAFEGTLTNLRPDHGDRAVMLWFALPIQATGWTWHDDIRRSRVIDGHGEYFNGTSVGGGTTGTMSVYPLATLQNGQAGLTLALDMASPAVFRLVYHAGAHQFLLAFDLGLVDETAQFPNAARFRFVLYRTDPRAGFRGGLDKLARIFPDHFRVRSARQGLWMPFTDVSTVADWQDFGFRYHEGDNNVGWDDQHDVLSFRYTEPMTWWMSMSPELPRTESEALKVRDALAAGPAGKNRDYARVSQTASMTTADGTPALLFRNEPWANGAVWSLNPNPALPGTPNAATLHWNDAARTRYTGDQPFVLDGEYLDSLEGYVTAELNYRREHFAASSVPLTFSTDTRHPALFKGLAIQEFTRWISDDVHRVGGLMFANGVPYRFGFLCPWLDVLGTETDWMPGGTYTPVSDAQLCLWRSLAGAKPYLLLMNTDFTKFTTNAVERYFQRALAYGMWPSMFSANAAENPYWQNPAWYNRDRPLFRKYLPLIRAVAEAGWQPVTAATFDAADVPVERFGTLTNNWMYFTLLNDAAEPRIGTLRVDASLVGASTRAQDRGTGQALVRGESGWEVRVPALSTTVVELELGPRFLAVERVPTPAPSGTLRLTVGSPLEQTQVLEESRDLVQWKAVRTNTPLSSPFTMELPPADDTQRRFLRLRW